MKSSLDEKTTEKMRNSYAFAKYHFGI